MFHTARNKINLLSRNEGKIKSYDSCTDVRAWSHDNGKRHSYLRDWIKCDMPVCVIPVYTVASFLTSMTVKNRGRITPRCQPDCRSKVILDSIYISCHAIKECLKKEEKLQKCFEEEEFETSHWPCEKCLEILKNIKLFWKIMLEKIFRINIPSSNKYDNSKTESINDITKIWQDEIVNQTIFAKGIPPLISNDFSQNTNQDYIKKMSVEKVAENLYKIKINVEQKDKAVGTNFLTNITPDIIKSGTDFFKPPFGNVEKNDFIFNSMHKHCSDIFKNDQDYLQQRINMQYRELRRLQLENYSLKVKLKNAINKCSLSTHTSCVLTDHYNTVLKPFEACYDEESEDIKDIKSEMIITLKNCKNKDFQHISILQVLHKTNGLPSTESVDCCRFNKDNPIELLTRVHNKFGAIVGRELNMAQKNNNSSGINIKTSFYQAKTNKSATSSYNTSSTVWNSVSGIDDN